MIASIHRIFQLAVVATFAMACTGCVSVFPNLNTSAVPAVTNPETVANATANYYVEMHPVLGKPKVYTGVISKPTTVQEALEASGALKEYPAMLVDLHRRLPNGASHKLPVEFKKGKQVKYEQDYALHPNDRIVVQAKSNSPLDKIVVQVFGEL